MATLKKLAKKLLVYLSLSSQASLLEPPLPEFSITGTKNLHDSPDYRDVNFIERFNPSFENFQSTLVKEVVEKSGSTYFKYGDGDYYFLKGEENGSAKPGKRALSKPYSEIDLPRFRQGSLRATHYMCEIPDSDRDRFQSTFYNLKVDFPAEYVYGAVASRWFFKQFDGRIGLIGAAQKIDLIEELQTFDSYRNYLGISKKLELVRIPQKFACDDLDQTISMLQEQLEGKTSEIFLFGVGHVKSGIIEHLPKLHRATYVDIGSGIDALAGVIDVSRPYFGDWINFELPNSGKYKEIDWLQVQNRGTRFFLAQNDN